MDDTKITVILEPVLPTEIKILHKTFSLHHRQWEESFGNGRLAEINFMNNEINYLPLSGSETVDSIVHELLHGVFHMFNSNAKLSEDEEEHIVSTLAIGIVTIMSDNPDLFPVLQDMLDD
jgi:hypothetical protein